MPTEPLRSLDATDATQILVAIQGWISGLKDPTTEAPLLPSKLELEFPSGAYGYYIKGDGGDVLEEDICGNFTAEVPFAIYYTTNDVADSVGDIFKPLNDLSAWFRANGVKGLDIGTRRVADTIQTLKGPTDLSGQDEKGNTTFFSLFSLIYDEEVP